MQVFSYASMQVRKYASMKVNNYENGIPYDKYNIRSIAHARTNRKDDIFMQRRLKIDKAQTALDIFRFAVCLSFLKPPAWFYVPR